MKMNAPTAPDAQMMREVPGCRGIYSVTTDGRVWSSPREWTAGKGSPQGHAGRWLTPVVDATGYERVRLTVDGARSLRQRHADGETVADLARAFSIDRKTVYGVLQGRTYRA